MTDRGRALHVATGHEVQWPGITIPAPKGKWDLSAFARLTMTVTNTGSDPVTVTCRVDSSGVDDAKTRVSDHIELKPGETNSLDVTLTPRLPAALNDKLFGMRGYPGGMSKDKGLDTHQINQLLIFVDKPKQNHSFQVADIRPAGRAVTATWISMDADQFFPMIDELGQFIHGEWPGKTHSLSELTQTVASEDADHASHPGPDDWNQYGGWHGGPQLEATGFFRVSKVDGKWWLVDPEGRLFWSHGVDCVGHRQGPRRSRIANSTSRDLPANDSPLADFLRTRILGTARLLQGQRVSYRTFCFHGANLHAQVRRAIGGTSRPTDAIAGCAAGG